MSPTRHQNPRSAKVAPVAQEALQALVAAGFPPQRFRAALATLLVVAPLALPARPGLRRCPRSS